MATTTATTAKKLPVPSVVIAATAGVATYVTLLLTGTGTGTATHRTVAPAKPIAPAATPGVQFVACSGGKTRVCRH